FPPVMEVRVDVNRILGAKFVEKRLKQLEVRIAGQGKHPTVSLVFLAAFIRYGRGGPAQAAAHAKTLGELAGTDKIYRTFSGYLLTGKVSSATKHKAPAKAKKP
ncbi:hypothetical protein LCGC14_2060890, partial [marine sediment metagenome]